MILNDTEQQKIHVRFGQNNRLEEEKSIVRDY